MALTRIDHVMICVPDLPQGIDTYRRIGFDVHLGGVHTGRGTHNAIASVENDYLELMAVRDRDEYAAKNPTGGLLEFLAKGGGFRFVAVQSDDVAADAAAMRSRVVDVSEPVESGRRTPAGLELRWKAAFLGPRNPLPVFFIQHLNSVDERRKQVASRAHPNGAQRIDRVYINVDDVGAAADMYSRVLGIAKPNIQRGAVIKADMAVFNLGPTGLTVAQPAEPGPSAEAMARRGPGPFQVLYRTSGMDAAARWMGDHGMPPPMRGIRNTGEQAMLVTPEHACGAYIGFVGPA